MEYFTDIRLLPDPEFPAPVLMNAVFSKLHRVLASHGEGKVGISFPQFNQNLGPVLRIHGTDGNLKKIMTTGWLASLNAYTTHSESLQVPAGCKYRLVQRVQARNSKTRIYRRSVRKGWLSEAEAQKRLENETNQQKRLPEPFISLRSTSTGQYFRLFIKHGPIQDFPTKGMFSAYGLSSSATIPWF